MDYPSGVHEQDSYLESLSWVLGCFVSNSTQEQCFHVPQVATRQEKVMEQSQCVQEQQHDARQDTYGGGGGGGVEMGVLFACVIGISYFQVF